jgi:hypothetical protein
MTTREGAQIEWLVLLDDERARRELAAIALLHGLGDRKRVPVQEIADGLRVRRWNATWICSKFADPV